MKTTVLVKCKCGHSFRLEDVEVDTIFIVTSSIIDEIKYTVDYDCPKCSEKGHATGYFH
ncbi:MAG: hypothetical protein KAJ47_00610 [Candidatus Aenigmarchaeota archaeon]|nr:hypothetical protein [Candidatus Aenigmarchaeota archaeon]